MSSPQPSIETSHRASRSERISATPTRGQLARARFDRRTRNAARDRPGRQGRGDPGPAGRRQRDRRSRRAGAQEASRGDERRVDGDEVDAAVGQPPQQVEVVAAEQDFRFQGGATLRGTSPPHQRSSCPAHAGHPVCRGLSVQSSLPLGYWIARPSAQLRTRRAMTVGPVIASEAKQSIVRHKERMDCFAEPVIGRAFARPGGSQ